MKKLTSFGLMAAGMVALSGCVTEVHEPQVSSPPPAPVVMLPGGLTPAAGEVARLAQAGTSEDVIMAYIQNTGALFNLSSDHIVFLKSNGASDNVVTAMLNHDQALRAQVVPAPAPAPAPVVTPPLVATAPPVYVSSPPSEVAYFYDDLRPYGAWIQVAGVGWCWQPQVVVRNPDWRPYCDAGHWIYTDAGWYWQSDYSWGWAPFHYGRWQMNERCGWVWVPDRVWGPSWVVWRTEGDHCGWAPLPPHADFDVQLGWRFNGVHVAVNFDFGLHPDHFTFVRFGDFNAHDLGHRRLDRPQVTRIYNNTTIINNYVVNNNTIINQGVRVDRVSEATHTQIRQVALRDAPAGSAAVSRPQAAGRNEIAYRTQLKAPAKPAKDMVAQKIDDRHPVVSHGGTSAVPSRNAPVAAVPGGRTEPAQASAPARISQPAPVSATEPTGTRILEQPRKPATTAARPVSERPAAQPQPTTRPAPATASKAPASAPAQPAAQPKSPGRTSTAYLPAPKPVPTVPSETPKQPGATSASSRGQMYPLRINAATPANQAQATAEGESSHVYQPKSARQAAERHALPPANPRATPKASKDNTPKSQPKRAE